MNESRAPRSVQFIDNYFPVIDGVTETVHEYARHMEHSTVVCPEMERHYLAKHSFTYPVLTSMTFRVPFSRYASAVPKIDRKLEKEIAETKPDIFHLHSPSLLGKYAVSLGKRMKVPVVATFHSKYYDAIYEFTRNHAISKMVTAQIVKLYESCDEVWACSEETGETLRSYGFRKPYHVMPNGTDVFVPDNAEELKERAAAQFSVPRGKRVLLFVGQQIWYKNQRLILDTFRLLCDQDDSWFLIMAGSGKDEQDIARYAAALGLTEKQVLFTGLVGDRDLLRGIYLNADLLFFPSVFDNAPLVLREAAVLGVPTLAAEGSNAAGAIRKNFSGFTAAASPQAMYEEIIRIFSEEDIRQIGRNARETIPLSWERLMPMVLEEYQAVIDRYGKKR
ncbi:MAG: glycosyltransferase [Clostridia bacterium]|nr:glycosyltransferase [Clostridia bacterium]